MGYFHLLNKNGVYWGDITHWSQPLTKNFRPRTSKYCTIRWETTQGNPRLVPLNRGLLFTKVASHSRKQTWDLKILPGKTNMSPQNQMVGRCISPIEIIPSYGDMLVWTGGFSPLGKGETSANQQFSGPPKKTQKRGEKRIPSTLQ